MPDIIRSKSIQLYSKKPIQRERFVSQMREVTEFEQLLNQARAEIEIALRRFAKKLVHDGPDQEVAEREEDSTLEEERASVIRVEAEG